MLNNKNKSTMNKSNSYTQKELDDLVKMHEQGATNKEIAEMIGRTEGSVATKLWQLNKERKAKEAVKKEVQAIASPQPMTKTIVVPAKQKTLDDFSPREMIRHLWKMGYRIEDGKLVCYQRMVVNMGDVLKEEVK